jgi:leucyl aminopeptidase
MLNAELFYDTSSEKAIPVYLISQTQLEEQLPYLSALDRNYLTERQFKGKLSDYALIYNADGLLEKAYIGAGENNQERAVAIAATGLPPGRYQLQEPLTDEAALYWSLAQYRFLEYKKHDLKPRVLQVDANSYPAILALADATFLVRDLINRPTNDLGPKQLAKVVSELAETHGAVFQEWVGDELLTANFPAIHAVGRASAEAPRLLSLCFGEAHHPKITLVGKGVCFDSGGLDVKPSSGMRLMKKDMGGAAHVIGLAKWIMTRRLPIRLELLIPAVENAIGPNAFRPGDVLRMRNGLTVEIENTDAEGRLILADALVKACEDPPELLIDFATLTGAARIAVGTEIGALFSNNDLVAADLMALSKQTADPLWRMPLFSGYEDLLKSNIADMVNCNSSPYSGAIVAGLFLQRFIKDTVPWVHLDVMAWNISSKPGRPEGGEAMGLRALAAYLLKKYSHKGS